MPFTGILGNDGALLGNVEPGFDQEADLGPAPETLTKTEALSTQQADQVPVAETLTQTENLASTQTTSPAVSETLTQTVAGATQQAGQVPNAESLNQTTALTSQQAQQLPVSETLTQTEALIPSVGITKAVSESLTRSEAVGTQVDWRPTPTEELLLDTETQQNAVDTQSPVAEDVRHTQQLFLTEGMLPSAGVFTNVSESHTVSDGGAVGTFQNFRPNLSENLTVSDDFTSVQTDSLNVSETLTLTDAATGVRGRPPVFNNESLVFQSETVATHLDFFPNPAESMFRIEAVQITKNQFVNVSEPHYFIEKVAQPRIVREDVSWAQGAYANTPFGGFSLESFAPFLVSSIPANNAPSQVSSVPVFFHISCPIDLDPYSLNVTFNGTAQAIVAGDFRPGYDGDIFISGDTCKVTIGPHPDFPTGFPTTVAISIRNLAGEVSNFNYLFYVGAGVVTNVESLSLTENLGIVYTPTLGDTLNQNVTLTVVDSSGLQIVENPNPIQDSVDPRVGVKFLPIEVLSLFESVQASSFIVASLDGRTIRVSLPEDLHIENVGYLRNYAFLPMSEAGAEITIHSVEPTFSPITSGVKGEVIPAFKVAGQGSIAADILTDFSVDFLGTGVGPGDIIAFDPTPTLTVKVVEVIDSHRLALDTGFGTPFVAYYRVNKHPSETTQFFRNVVVSGPQDLFNDLNKGDLLRLASRGASLAVPATSSATTLTVTSSNSLPTTPFKAMLEHESILVQSRSGNVLTVVRGQDSTAADAHPVNTFLSVVGQAFNNDIDNLIIVDVVNPYVVRVDRPLAFADPFNGNLAWLHKSGVQGFIFKTSESTRDEPYRFTIDNLRTKVTKRKFTNTADFIAFAERPKLTGVSFLEDGTVLLDFNEDMRFDGALSNPEEYEIVGPTTVSILNVYGVSPRRVALLTSGLGAGSYTVTVNATGTPKDEAGNPIDPSFNQAIFTASIPQIVRSVFTDKGPIAKPAITLQSGTGVTLHTYTSPIFGSSTFFTSNEVTLQGGAFTPDHVGLCVRLLGTQKNDGIYKVLGLVGASPTPRIRLQASFTLPDTNNGSAATTWALIDPRDGEIADDPADVTVRVNGVPVIPQAVIGLLGQVVLPAAPSPTDDVKIDYAWVPDPTVDFRRLNSREFRLNNWAYDAGSRGTPTQHQYRYRTTLVLPSNYTPDNMLAPLDGPLLRNVFYRAYERAYSALLNDPALLRLNTPTNQIAYTPLKRSVAEESAAYTANSLPENDPVFPWVRKGLGPASVASGVLTIEDNTTGPFPGGNPLFWQRDLDLSFDHVFAATWRMTIPTVSAMEGVFTGISVGWSNASRAIVLGYLEEGGVKKLGILKKGGGLDPSIVESWIGGTSTNAPVDFDWSILHSYRFFRGRDGVVRLFVDGEVSERLRVVEDDLPYLEELNTPFDNLQGVFFGSISRPAKTVSVWDFVRYVVLPTNPEQTAPAIFVAYEGASVPEEAAPNPWTPLGYHGTERIENDALILESTSVTDPSIESQVGLVGGDFKGFTRIEPLLSVASKVDVDVKLKILAWTHGITNDALMVAVDDGHRLVQLSFFSEKGQPKFSYPGRSLPEEAVPVAWTKVGTASNVDIFGRTLRIEDTSTTSGLAYFIEDLNAVDSDGRVVSSLIDYIFEFRTKVTAYSPDPAGFCGVTADVSDGVRTIGLRFKRDLGTLITSGTGVAAATTFTDSTKNFSTLGVLPGDELFVMGNSYAITKVVGSTLTVSEGVPFPGAVSYQVRDTVRKVEFHSDGVAVGTPMNFEWFDGNFHTFRVAKSSSNGTVVTNGFSGALATTGPTTLFTDLSNSFTAAGVIPGDVVVVASGPSTGCYPVLAVINSSTLQVSGTVIQSTGIVYRIERGRNMTVSVFANDTLLGTENYASFQPAETTTASMSFGSASAPTVQAGSMSTVDWMFYNVWRVDGVTAKYAGIWKGRDSNTLMGYYLPLKTQGAGQAPTATTLTDASADFVAAGVQVGDVAVIDDGPNKGEYKITGVLPTQLFLGSAFALAPSEVIYRIPSTVDWTQDHLYRIVRDPAGSVALFLDAETSPRIKIPYNEVSLPASALGTPSKLQGGFPSITWGAFDPTNLSRSAWDYLRYGIVRSPTEDRRVPEHEVLNQRNVMASAEHLKGIVPHAHTQFSSASTGIPYPWKDFIENPLVKAYTQLNEGTPIVPQTQTYEVRRPTPVFVPVSSLNNPDDVLNSDGDFLLNDATTKVELIVPNDVLYNSLEITERTDGELDLLTPIADQGIQHIRQITYQKETCLHYDGSVLPEDDALSPTPWALATDPGASYSATPVTGILNLTANSGQVLYRNDTPLPDPVGLDTEVSFRFKVVTDATTGTGDSGIRVGFSALGITAALAFVTTPLGDREVRLLDLFQNLMLGAIPFDFLDGQYHTYRLYKNVAEGTVDFFIDP